MKSVSGTMKRNGIGFVIINLIATMGASYAHADPVNSCDPDNPAPECFTTSGDVWMQPVQSVFRFQAKVAKGKIPLGTTLLDRVYVSLTNGGPRDLCTELHTNIAIQDSVLNLQIGAQKSCADLARTLAEQSNVQLRVCINTPQQCLDPIQIGVVPYAAKAQYAYQAQQAHTARQAAEASYAHRMTADPNVQSVQNGGGIGYFDFRTPAARVEVSNVLQSDDVLASYLTGGVMAWRPTVTAPGSNTLHIAGRDASDALRKLEQATVHAAKVEIRGDLKVLGTADVALLPGSISTAALNPSVWSEIQRPITSGTRCAANAVLRDVGPNGAAACVPNQSPLADVCAVTEALFAFDRNGTPFCVPRQSPLASQCPDGQVLQSFTQSGVPTCVARQAPLVSQCANTDVLQSIAADGGFTCVSRQAPLNSQCASTHVLQAIGPNGTPTCVLRQVPLVTTCGEYEALRGFDASGNPVCKKIPRILGVGVEVWDKARSNPIASSCSVLSTIDTGVRCASLNRLTCPNGSRKAASASGYCWNGAVDDMGYCNHYMCIVD